MKYVHFRVVEREESLCACLDVREFENIPYFMSGKQFLNLVNLFLGVVKIGKYNVIVWTTAGATHSTYRALRLLFWFRSFLCIVDVSKQHGILSLIGGLLIAKLFGSRESIDILLLRQRFAFKLQIFDADIVKIAIGGEVYISFVLDILW